MNESGTVDFHRSVMMPMSRCLKRVSITPSKRLGGMAREIVPGKNRCEESIRSARTKKFRSHTTSQLRRE